MDKIAKLQISNTDLMRIHKEIDAMENDFLASAHKWRQYFSIQDYKYLTRFKDVIFEGSQGIMLDKDHGIFPNVTYANTTSKNAVEVCEKMGFTYDMFYVTRCYQTRHGNGWMSSEKPVELINNEEEINVENEWQGKFKTADIDYKLLDQAIEYDRIYSNHAKARSLMVTCLDQRPDFRFELSKLAYNFDSVWYSKSPDAKHLCSTQDEKIKEVA